MICEGVDGWAAGTAHGKGKVRVAGVESAELLVQGCGFDVLVVAVNGYRFEDRRGDPAFG
ncbi:hypothetical protein GCM10022197_13980 [Microlunatus spumicola]|uniref:Uncharacterized protein n=1 Tax=Microlunatus spumicola TaxID=81499 RepID=A0ABP6X3C1_9ACTN